MYTEFTGNPHQDQNPWKSFTGGFGQGWRDRKLEDKPKMYPGGPPGDPKNVFPTFPLPRREDSENWIPYGGGLGPLAELSQKQMNYMQNPYMNPALGGISEEELWNNVKGMDYVRPWYKPWGKESQEPSTRSEFNDFQKQLQRSGIWAT